jgi:hypothetical protein
LQRHWLWIWTRRRVAEAADSSANPAKVLLTSRQFYLSPPCGERSPRTRGEGAKAFVELYCRACPGSRHQLSGKLPRPVRH